MSKYFAASLILILGLVFVPHTASADAVKFPSGPAIWTIDVTDSQLAVGKMPPRKAPRVTRIAISQDEEKRRTVLTMSDGQTKEKWEFPKMFLVIAQDPDGTPFAAMNGGLIGQAEAVPFEEADFSWIKPQFLQERQPITYQGHQCFHYKGHRPYLQGAAVLPDIPCEAWIDSTTLEPVALDTGVMVGNFTYQKDPPPTPLTLPPQFQSKLDRWEMCLGVVKPNSK